MAMTTDEVLSKINKLLNLSKGTSNINEAAAAAAAAQKLMDEYNIERCSIEMNTSTIKKESIEENSGIISGGRIENWRWSLLHQIATINNCRTLRYRARHEKTNISLVGTRSNIQTVRYLFMYLSGEIDRFSAFKRGCGRDWIASYKVGLVEGVNENLRKAHEEFMKNKYEEAHHTGVQALMVIDRAVAKLGEEKKELDEYMNKYTSKKRIVTKISAGDAFSRGIVDGRKISVANNGPRLGSGAQRLED